MPSTQKPQQRPKSDSSRLISLFPPASCRHVTDTWRPEKRNGLATGLAPSGSTHPRDNPRQTEPSASRGRAGKTGAASEDGGNRDDMENEGRRSGRSRNGVIRRFICAHIFSCCLGAARRGAAASIGQTLKRSTVVTARLSSGSSPTCLVPSSLKKKR